jgi:sec-independent protein translocase protein TatA
MFGLSGGHLLILGLVVLLFGARRLPELGESLGKGMRAFKSAVEGKEILTDQSQDKQSDQDRKV